MTWAMPTNATPRVPAVVHELPVTAPMRAQITRPGGEVNHWPQTANP